MLHEKEKLYEETQENDGTQKRKHIFKYREHQEILNNKLNKNMMKFWILNKNFKQKENNRQDWTINKLSEVKDTKWILKGSWFNLIIHNNNPNNLNTDNMKTWGKKFQWENP